jgi:hypothetical protein
LTAIKAKAESLHQSKLPMRTACVVVKGMVVDRIALVVTVVFLAFLGTFTG